ncbi:MAG TPA: hypothetical protein VMU51_23115 [Mycobacteriales bacterium]|nr:hypothetical protein [Mycobacteriales bacterium]
MTTTQPALAGTPPRPAAGRALLRRWPTVLGFATAALSLSDYENGLEFATILTLAAAGYLLVAVLARPAATWPLVVALTAVVVALRAADVDPVPVFAAAAVLLAAAGLGTGRLRRDALHLGQVPVALGCVAVALVALGVPADAGALLVAAGLLGHAAWDAVLWRAHRVVARSFAEWCGALDLTLGLGVVVLVLT